VKWVSSWRSAVQPHDRAALRERFAPLHPPTKDRKNESFSREKPYPHDSNSYALLALRTTAKRKLTIRETRTSCRPVVAAHSITGLLQISICVEGRSGICSEMDISQVPPLIDGGVGIQRAIPTGKRFCSVVQRSSSLFWKFSSICQIGSIYLASLVVQIVEFLLG